ncbi:MAG TPA: hypothetical protein VGE45_17410 [Chloroflexia bacterium]
MANLANPPLSWSAPGDEPGANSLNAEHPTSGATHEDHGDQVGNTEPHETDQPHIEAHPHDGHGKDQEPSVATESNHEQRLDPHSHSGLGEQNDPHRHPYPEPDGDYHPGPTHHTHTG